MTFGIYERADSRYWWVWFRDESGKRKHSSTGLLRDDPLAWQQAYNAARAKVAVAKREVSIKGLFDDWVEDYFRSLFTTGETLDAKLRHWRFIRAYLGSLGINAPSGVTYNVAIGYKAWRVKNKRRGAIRAYDVSAALELRMLRSILNESVVRGYIANNPLAMLRIKGGRSRIKPEFNEEQERMVRAALMAKEGHLPLRDRWMTISFEIAMKQGWRLAETSFPLDRVDFNAWTVLVHQKGDRWRTVPVHPELRPLLTQLKADGVSVSCVFPKNNPKEAARAWSWLLRGEPNNRHRKPGILPTHCFHCARVTVISRLTRRGVPEHLVMEYVGHTSRVTQAIYRRISVGDLGQIFAHQSNAIAQNQGGDAANPHTIPP